MAAARSDSDVYRSRQYALALSPKRFRMLRSPAAMRWHGRRDPLNGLSHMPYIETRRIVSPHLETQRRPEFLRD